MVTVVTFLAHQAALHAPSHVPNFALTAIALRNILNHVLPAWSLVTAWSCPHFTYTQPCGMPCNRPPCDQPCPKRLEECKHRCIGLCGEVCPKVCRICNKEEVTEIIFGPEDEEDARFILLPDCNHIVMEMLDKWMSTDNSNPTGESQEITLKVCPRCKTAVRKFLRYGNDVRSKLADVEAIKKKQMSTIDSIDLQTELAR